MRFEIKRHEAARDVGEDAVYGVYVLRSNRDPTLMRIGGAGVRDRGTFRGRLATHNDAPTAVNWTTRNRTWRALWTATLLGGGSSKVIWAAEHILFARFSQDYPLVDQSGFSVAPFDEAGIVRIADETVQALQRICRVQSSDLADPRTDVP